MLGWHRWPDCKNLGLCSYSLFLERFGISLFQPASNKLFVRGGQIILHSRSLHDFLLEVRLQHRSERCELFGIFLEYRGVTWLVKQRHICWLTKLVQTRMWLLSQFLETSKHKPKGFCVQEGVQEGTISYNGYKVFDTHLLFVWTEREANIDCLRLLKFIIYSNKRSDEL